MIKGVEVHDDFVGGKVFEVNTAGKALGEQEQKHTTTPPHHRTGMAHMAHVC